MIDMRELDELERQIALYKFKVAMKEAEQSVREEGTISLDDLKKELGVWLVRTVKISQLARRKAVSPIQETRICSRCLT